MAAGRLAGTLVLLLAGLVAPAARAQEDACANVSLVDSGEFSLSPDSGSHGRDIDDCRWLLSCSDPAQVPTLSFSTFYTGSCYMFAAIHDGADEHSELIVPATPPSGCADQYSESITWRGWAGSDSPGVRTAAGPSALVRVTGDAVFFHYAEFNASFECGAPEVCAADTCQKGGTCLDTSEAPGTCTWKECCSCDEGTAGSRCESCRCDRDDYTECWVQRGSGCRQCEDETGTLEKLATAAFFLGLFLIGPAVIWKMSRFKTDAVDGTVKGKDVLQRLTSAQGKPSEVAAGTKEAASTAAATSSVAAAPAAQAATTAAAAAAPATAAVAATAATAAAPVLQMAQTATTLLPHVQISSLCFEVNLHWPPSVQRAAEWFREAAFFDFVSLLTDNTCTIWREQRDRDMNRCDLTSVEFEEHEATTPSDITLPLALASDEGICVKRLPTAQKFEAEAPSLPGDFWEDYRGPRGYKYADEAALLEAKTAIEASDDDLYDQLNDNSIPMKGIRWYSLNESPVDDSDSSEWPVLSTRPTEYDSDQGRCMADSDCVPGTLLSSIMRGIPAADSADGPEFIALVQLLVKLGLFIALVLVFVLVVYLPASCIPNKRWPERYFGSREHAKQHAINAIAAAHTLLIMLIAKGCFSLIDIEDADSDGARRLVAVPSYSTSECEDSKVCGFFNFLYLGWGVTVLLVAVPPLWYLNRVWKAGRLVARWEDDGSITIGTERWFPDFQRAYGFVYLRYDPWAWWYEAAATTRKVMLVAFTVLLSEDQIPFALLSLLVVTLALWLQLKYKPFLDGEHTFASTPVGIHPRKIADSCAVQGDTTAQPARPSRGLAALKNKSEVEAEAAEPPVQKRRCGQLPPRKERYSCCFCCTRTRCKYFTKLVVGAVVGIAVPLGLHIYMSEERSWDLVIGTGGGVVTFGIVVASAIGVVCTVKLLSTCCCGGWCWCCCSCGAVPTPEYEVVVDGVAIAVDGVPGDADQDTVLNAQVSRREHVGEDAVEESDADAADTLEQIALVSMFVLLMMGLLTYLINLLPESDPVTVITVALSCVALVAAAAPFVATYWLYTHPDDKRVALWLAPIGRCLSPIEKAAEAVTHAYETVSATDDSVEVDVDASVPAEATETENAILMP